MPVSIAAATVSALVSALASAPLVSVHLATALFGFAGVLGASVGLSAIEVTFGRTLFAALTLYGVCRYLGASIKLKLRCTGTYVLLLSGLLLAVHWWTFFASIKLSTVAICLVTFSTCPVFVAVLEPLVFKEKWRATTLLSALLVVAGVIIISGLTTGGVAYLQGILFGLASGFCFAILQLLNRRLTNINGPLVTSLIQNSVASLVLLPWVFVGLREISLSQWLILLLLGVACTAVAHTLFISALKQVSVATASMIAAGLEPVYGVLLAALLLAQVPEPNVMIGGAIILSTVLVVTVKQYHSP